MPSPFIALRHRDYRLFWSGQCVSLIGTWMQNVAQDWLVLQLTDSSFKLGLLVAAKFVPMMFVPLFAGVVAERYPKRNIILLTQTLLMLQAVILSVLTGLNAVRYEHVLVLVFFWGLVNSFDMPTRQAYVIELAGRDDVMNAVALNSAIFNMARLVGPALAGLALAQFGTAICFALNAASFLAVIAGLVPIAPGKRGEGPILGAAWEEIGRGFRYIFHQDLIRDALILLTVLSIFTMNFGVLIPAFAKFTLAGNARTLGYLWSSLGLGALCAAFALAVMSHRGPQRGQLILAGFGLCLGQLLVSATRSFALAVPAFVLTGLSMTSFNASVNTTLQITADDGYRGRVMSVYALVVAGFTPLGSLFAGSLAQLAGPPAAFACGAGAGLAGLGVMLAIWYGRWRRTARAEDAMTVSLKEPPVRMDG
ncbi:MAG: MFS transporter [Bacteroidota bacterium]